MRTGAAAGHAGYFHETAFYDSDDDLLGVVVPFLRGGQEAGEPTLVTLDAHHTALVRGTLDDVDGIDFVPGTAQYRNPALTIKDYRARFAALVADGAGQIRVVGDVPHPGTGGCWHTWSRYEAAVNTAYDDFPLWGLCPYDTRAADDDVLEDVARTHPHVATPDGGHHLCGAFVDPREHVPHIPAPRPLPLQRRRPDLELRDPSLVLARRSVTALAAAVVGPDDVDAATLAVSEVVTNAVRYGTAPVTVRGWAEPGRVIITVDDRGPGAPDPLVGLMPVPDRPDGSSMGAGLWLAHQVCTDVALDYRDGFTVRLLVEHPDAA